MMQWSFCPQGTSVNLVETLMIHGWALHPLEKKRKNMIYCNGCICNSQDLLQNPSPDTPVSHPSCAKPEWMKCYCHCWVGSWKTWAKWPRWSPMEWFLPMIRVIPHGFFWNSWKSAIEFFNGRHCNNAPVICIYNNSSFHRIPHEPSHPKTRKCVWKHTCIPGDLHCLLVLSC